MILTLLLAPCGQAFAEGNDYEAEALRKAEEAWAAKSQTDPARNIIDGTWGPSSAGSYEVMVGVDGGIPAAMLSKVLMVVRFSGSDAPLDLGLLNQALESAEDPETQERIRAEMQWGRPVGFTMTPAPDDPEGITRAEITYDSAGRRTGLTADDFTVSYTYDHHGNLSGKQLESGDNLFVILYRYDDQDRMIVCEMDANGNTASFSWEYDRYGNLEYSKRVFSNAENTADLTWNERGDLLGISMSDGGNNPQISIPRYESDAHSYSLTMNFGNGENKATGTFDEAHRITSMEIQDNVSTASETKYGESGGVLWTRATTEYTYLSDTRDIQEYSYNEYGSYVSWTICAVREDMTYLSTYVYDHDKFGRCETIRCTSDGEETVITLTY